MDWVGAAELSALAVVLVVLGPLVWLYLRRRWLSNRGGVFDCALRLGIPGRGTGWATGVARYAGDELQWFRTFSLSTRPRVVFRRDVTSALGHRPPSPEEAVMMFREDQILRIRSTGGRGREWELAMSPASVTGLMSWLEAAPPGGDSYSGLERRTL